MSYLKRFEESKNVLSKTEMKSIVGGGTGTCGYQYLTASNDYFTQCGVDKDTAMQQAAKGNLPGAHGGNWCCDSCATTSYCGDQSIHE